MLHILRDDRWRCDRFPHCYDLTFTDGEEAVMATAVEETGMRDMLRFMKLIGQLKVSVPRLLNPPIDVNGDV